MIDFDSRHLSAFRILAEELHFGRAAERLGTSQPHLSRIVRRIEKRLGVDLFERRPRVRLTAAGELFLDATRRALGELGVRHAAGPARRER